ncbi:MAG: sigma-70 family RNA polymerase sigma factor [Planctomycetales bacterium]|nr:sigma-70 family RNA polymerase sigma factor [Planctomycetales bacterium]
MSGVTRVITQAAQGVPGAPDVLLALVYGELRRLAECKMRQENSAHTLQPTALVHEAFVRLVDSQSLRGFDNRGHFFAAAAEAMRRILIEYARRRRSLKHGGQFTRCELSESDAFVESYDVDSLLDLDAALTKLAREEPEMARLVELRYFTGLSVDEAAEVLGVSPRTVKRNWAFARAWLGRELNRGLDVPSSR